MDDNYLIISDTHFPYHNPGVIKFLRDVYEEYDCNKVAHVGDLLDLHGLSRYAKDPDMLSAGHEIQKGVEQLQYLYDTFPDVDLVLGNHDLRTVRKAFEIGLPKQLLRSYTEIIQAPKGWKIHPLEFETENFVVRHGDFNRSIGCNPNTFMNHVLQRGKSIVCGHFHTAMFVNYIRTEGRTLFGMVTSCLIDPDSPTFSYDRLNTKRPMLGCGVVRKGVPIPVPFYA